MKMPRNTAQRLAERCQHQPRLGIVAQRGIVLQRRFFTAAAASRNSTEKGKKGAHVLPQDFDFTSADQDDEFAKAAQQSVSHPGGAGALPEIPERRSSPSCYGSDDFLSTSRQTAESEAFRSGSSLQEQHAEELERPTSSVVEHASEDAPFSPTEMEQLKSEIRELFTNLRSQALSTLHDFSPVHLFSLVWAFSTARSLDDGLYFQLSRRALVLAMQMDQRWLAGVTEEQKKRIAEFARTKQSSTAGEKLKETAHEMSLGAGSPDTPSAASGGNDDADFVYEKAVSSDPVYGLVADLQALYGQAASTSCESEKTSSEIFTSGKNYGCSDLEIVRESPHWFGVHKTITWLVNQTGDGTSADDEGDDAGSGGPQANDATGQRKSQSRKAPSVHHWVKRNFSNTHPLCGRFDFSFGILHRLDLETSGALLCAKTWLAYYWLRLQWCAVRVKKEYLVVVHGHMDRDIKECRGRIKVLKRIQNGRKTCVSRIEKTGKPAKTGIEVLAHLWMDAADAGDSDIKRGRERDGHALSCKNYMGAAEDSTADDEVKARTTASSSSDEEQRRRLPLTLVKCRLFTGRTHQIRVHFSQGLKHPIFGDKKYNFSDAQVAKDNMLWKSVLRKSDGGSGRTSSPGGSGEAGIAGNGNGADAEVERDLSKGKSIRAASLPPSVEQTLRQGRMFLHTHSLEFDDLPERDAETNEVKVRRQRIFVPLSEELRALLRSADGADDESRRAVSAWTE